MLFSQIQGIFVFKMACFIPNYITQMSSSEYLMGWFIPTLSAHIKNYCYRERRKDLPPHNPSSLHHLTLYLLYIWKIKKSRKKCWKSVIFCLSIVGSDVKPGIFHSPRLHSLPRQCGSCRQRCLSADIHGDVRHSFVASCINNPRRHLTLHPLENPEICAKSD